MWQNIGSYWSVCTFREVDEANGPVNELASRIDVFCVVIISALIHAALILWRELLDAVQFVKDVKVVAG